MALQPVAQGIRKTLAYKKQSALGTAATGSGGQLLRRRTASFNLTRETYENDEIVSHQQSTGATAGLRRAAGRVDGLLSPGTYKDFIAAALRKDFVATTAITGLSVTIAGTGPTYTITRSASWMTDGIKIGDVIRLSVGSLNAANIAKNLLIVNLTSTVATVIPLNGVALVAEGPVTGTTVTVIGKKSWAPISGHTDDWFTFEQFYADLTRSELFTDVKPGSINFGLPATGNANIALDFVGLNRTLGNAQVLTSPTVETTTPVVSAVTGALAVGNSITLITGAQVTLSGGINEGEAEVGSNFASDVQRGRIAVSGSFTAKFRSADLQTAFDDQSTTYLILALPADSTATSDFVTLVMPKIKIMSDEADDGEKEIVRTYNFTAEIQGAGGASAAHHQTIMSVQDSQA